MAPQDLKSVLELFTRTSARLNEASDAVNATLAEVESRLVAANAGVEVWMPRALSSTDAEGTTSGESTVVVTRLGFAKVEGRWGLATKRIRIARGYFEGDVSCPYVNEFGDGDPAPLLQGTRQDRIAALELLPDLIRLLTAEADRRIQMIRDAGSLVATN